MASSLVAAGFRGTVKLPPHVLAVGTALVAAALLLIGTAARLRSREV